MPDRSKIDIANRALDVLKLAEMANLEHPQGDVEEAIARNMDGARREAVEKGAWSLARVSVSLPGRAIEDDDYPYEITLPTDCAKVLRVGPPQARADCAFDYGLSQVRGIEAPALYERLLRWTRQAGPGAGAVRLNVEPPVQVVYARLPASPEMSEALFELTAAILANRVKGKTSLSRAERDEVEANERKRLAEAVLVNKDETPAPTREGSAMLDVMDGW